MEKTLTKEELKELLVGKRIVDVEISPYLRVILDDNSIIEVVPAQLTTNEFTYLDLAFKQMFDDE